MHLYHGSVQPGIRQLRAMSPLHGHQEQKVVYLTGSPVYALFYIWDAQHNKKAGKHVTCRLKDGVVYYEEQFDGQLRAFYEGVSGWLYSVQAEDAQPVAGRENMWCCAHDVPMEHAEFIPDVYARLQQEMRSGRVAVTQMPREVRAQLRQHLAVLIRSSGWIHDPDCEEAVFYRTYFPDSWQDAVQAELFN